ncbi:nuclear transport factor 2 family protein [Marixanthomonas ophiurae]|uniref:Nuclear transport factor 2 family protein n=1 Tax=Marixanthomonas ophiurae TaxID=387659 RepID=A0A3E1QDE9_9FLAO|nr:nuclear transport factor 2 family protein [Marixanthomonas ophiurae]RFN60086.1 nuclear transport factor 2 family protein [Marixanthomonas ophiurae]
MKKLFLLGLAIVLFSNCESNVKQRYTQQSPEIDTYKKVIDAYEKKDWKALASHYADTVKIMNNVVETEGQTLSELVASNKEDASLFASWNFVDKESEYEMVITDKNQTWVNFWGLWEGNLKANNRTYSIPVHITARFVDGKIVKEFGYWDPSKIMLDMQEIQMKEMEETANNEESNPENE